MAGETGATTNRTLNKLQYAAANVAATGTLVASNDVTIFNDVSADYASKAATPHDWKLGAIGSRIINSTSTALAITLTQHAERVVLWAVNSSGTSTATLPAATGSGAIYRIVNNLQQTQGTLVITAAGTDVISGKALMFDSTAAADAMIFKTSATSVKATWDRTTKGGIGYDEFEAIDAVAGTWLVTVTCNASGTIATPLSA